MYRGVNFFHFFRVNFSCVHNLVFGTGVSAVQFYSFFFYALDPFQKKNMSDHPPQVRDKYDGGQRQVYLEIAQVDYHANMEVLARKLIDLQLIYYYLISKKRDTGSIHILHNQVRGKGGKGGSQILMFIAAKIFQYELLT